MGGCAGCAAPAGLPGKPRAVGGGAGLSLLAAAGVAASREVLPGSGAGVAERDRGAGCVFPRRVGGIFPERTDAGAGCGIPAAAPARDALAAIPLAACGLFPPFTVAGHWADGR